MKRISYGMVVLIACLFCIPNIFALDTSFKVYDDAGLLTSEEIQQLQEQVQEYIEKYDMDMVLVTTNNSYGAGSTADYADDFYDDNGFGVGEKKNGILLLIDRTYGYNDLHISTTGEAILVYNDSRIESILDDIVYQKENGYYSMFSAFISSASKYAESGVVPSNNHYYIDEFGVLRKKRVFPWVMVLIITLAVPSLIVGILIHRNKMIKKATTATAYLDQKSIQYTRREDRFITTHTSSVHIPRNTGGSGGGGSSIHTGHSGVSHGGGGRRC